MVLKELSKIDDGDTKYSSCTEGEISKVPHRSRKKKKGDVLELVHSDLSSKIEPVSYNRDQYIQLLDDDADRLPEI